MWAGTETSRAAQIASNLDQSEVMLYSIIYKIHYKEFRIYTFCRLVVVVVGSINGGGGIWFSSHVTSVNTFQMSLWSWSLFPSLTEHNMIFI